MTKLKDIDMTIEDPFLDESEEEEKKAFEDESSGEEDEELDKIQEYGSEVEEESAGSDDDGFSFNLSRRVDDENDGDLSVAEIMKRARQTKSRRITAQGPTARKAPDARGTVIAEVDSEDERDSFDIKREMKKKKKFEKYGSKLEALQQEVAAHSSKTS